MEEAQKAFLPQTIDPTVSRDQTMYDAGAQAVLAWLDKKLPVSKRTVQSDELDNTPLTTEGRLRRMLE